MGFPYDTPVHLRSITITRPSSGEIDPAPGGMYASGKGGEGKQIETAPLTPEFYKTQKWIITKPDKNGNSAVLYHPKSEGLLVGWHTEKPKNGSSILLELGSLSPYSIESVGKTQQGEGIWTFSVFTGLLGADYLVGSDKENKLQLEAVPVLSPEYPVPAPAWIIKQAD